MPINQLKWVIIVASIAIMAISCINFSTKKISFNSEIRPIFNKKCIVCHGGVRQNGNFSLLFRENALSKAKSGKFAIIPFESEKSELIKRIKTHDLEQRMPKEKEPLTSDEINRITKWIDQGAEWEDHWAYIAPDKNIEAPNRGGKWPVNGIDNFIYEKLEHEGLKPSAEADKNTILRRLSLDLIGLPPSVEETETFVNDKSENAFEKQVDRLLKSPAFGERWAAMWLDLARYADSKGYEKDLDRNIWQYRDWVINAFNNNMPFDQFTIEQLAGDLLYKKNSDLKVIENQLIATAFHRNTMANDEGGTNDEEFRNAAVVDRVSTTMEVWQGTTMACVQCHSHPYDPFRHDDFYKLAAFFNNSQDRDLYNDKPFLKTFEPGNELKTKNLLKYIQENIPNLSQQNLNISLEAKREKILKEVGFYRIEAEYFDSTSRHIELINNGKTIMQTTEGAFTKYENVDFTGINQVNYRYQSGAENTFIEMHIDSVAGPTISRVETHCSEEKVNVAWYSWKGYTNSTGNVKPINGIHDMYLVYRKGKNFWTDLIHLDWIELGNKNSLRNKLPKYLTDSIQKLAEIEVITLPIMIDRPKNKARKTYVFNRGNWMDHGKEVFAGIPQILNPNNVEHNNRLDLAKWLVSDKNPLTARVMVNRFWEQLFGLGLVETLEDFGTMGAKPNHPELLDWLAVQFQFQQKWDVKKILKLMVMSATYRQAAKADAKLQEKDPKNIWLARGPRVRLSSEQIRDQALKVCGLLNTTQFGPSVKPPNPTDESWRIGPEKNLYRRAIYTYWRRTNPYPSMITFDSPQRNVCTSRRVRTNTPLQALNTLNDTVYYAAAENIAIKILKTKPKTLDDKINIANQIIFQKPLNKDKKEILSNFYNESFADFKKKKKANAEFLALTILANAMMNTDEFLTK